MVVSAVEFELIVRLIICRILSWIAGFDRPAVSSENEPGASIQVFKSLVRVVAMFAQGLTFPSQELVPVSVVRFDMINDRCGHDEALCVAISAQGLTP